MAFVAGIILINTQGTTYYDAIKLCMINMICSSYKSLAILMANHSFV